jgi:hypothetical protein
MALLRIGGSDQHLDGRVVELWAGERLVKAFPADPSRRRFSYGYPGENSWTSGEAQARR